MSSVYDDPTVFRAMLRWRSTISVTLPRGDRDLHRRFVAAVMAERVRRGESVPTSYRRGA